MIQSVIRVGISFLNISLFLKNACLALIEKSLGSESQAFSHASENCEFIHDCEQSIELHHSNQAKLYAAKSMLYGYSAACALSGYQSPLGYVVGAYGAYEVSCEVVNRLKRS